LSQYDGHDGQTVTAIVAALRIESIGEDGSLLKKLLTGMESNLTNIAHFVIVYGEASCFFRCRTDKYASLSSTEQCKASLKTMLVAIHYVLGIAEGSEIDFCRIFLKCVPAAIPSTSLVISLHDAPTWEYFEKDIVEDKARADPCRHLLVILESYDSFWSDESKLKSLAYLSFFYDNRPYRGKLRKKSSTLDLSKSHQMVSFTSNRCCYKDTVILPPSSAVLEILKLGIPKYGGPPVQIPLGDFPRLRIFSMSIGAVTAALNPARFPALRELAVGVSPAGAKLDLSDWKMLTLSLSVKHFMGEIMRPMLLPSESNLKSGSPQCSSASAVALPPIASVDSVADFSAVAGSKAHP